MQGIYLHKELKPHNFSFIYLTSGNVLNVCFVIIIVVIGFVADKSGNGS